MAEEDVKLFPASVDVEEAGLTNVVVKLKIPGFAVEKKLFGSAKPKQGASECDVKFESMSLEVNASVTNKKGIPTKYRFKVKKLPGEVNLEKCSAEYKKDWVTLNLIKADEKSWAQALDKSGLEQM